MARSNPVLNPDARKKRRAEAGPVSTACSRAMRRPMGNTTLTSMLAKLPAERRQWLDSLSESERDYIATMIDKYGPELLTDAERFEGLKADHEYAKNF